MKLGLNDALISALSQIQRQQTQPARGNAEEEARQRSLAHGQASHQAAQTERLSELPPKAAVSAVHASAGDTQSSASQLRFERDIPRGSYLDITV